MEVKKQRSLPRIPKRIQEKVPSEEKEMILDSYKLVLELHEKDFKKIIIKAVKRKR